MGKACAVSTQTIANWRSRRARPTVDNALDMAEFLGWSDTRKIAERAK